MKVAAYEQATLTSINPIGRSMFAWSRR